MRKRRNPTVKRATKKPAPRKFDDLAKKDRFEILDMIVDALKSRGLNGEDPAWAIFTIGVGLVQCMGKADHDDETRFFPEMFFMLAMRWAHLRGEQRKSASCGRKTKVRK